MRVKDSVCFGSKCHLTGNIGREEMDGRGACAVVPSTGDRRFTVVMSDAPCTEKGAVVVDGP